MILIFNKDTNILSSTQVSNKPKTTILKIIAKPLAIEIAICLLVQRSIFW